MFKYKYDNFFLLENILKLICIITIGYAVCTSSILLLLLGVSLIYPIIIIRRHCFQILKYNRNKTLEQIKNKVIK